MQPGMKKSVTSSTINSRIQLSLFITIFLIISTLSILQYLHTRDNIKEEYRDAFTQSCVSLNGELKAVEEYVQRLNSLAKESYNTTFEPQFYSSLLSQAHSVMELSKTSRYYQLPKDTTIMGHLIEGTVCGLDTLSPNDMNIAKMIHMSLSLIPSQKAMHNSNTNITLSYFISSDYNFTQILPEIPIQSIVASYPDFEAFQRDAFQVFNTVSPIGSMSPIAEDSTKTLFWTTPYIDLAGNGMMVTCGTALYGNKKYRGIIGADVVLNFLNEYTQQSKELPGTLSIVTKEGAILSQTDLLYEKTDSLLKVKKSTLQSMQKLQKASSIQTGNTIITKLQHAPWYFVYQIDSKAVTRRTNHEMELIIISFILVTTLLLLAYFYIHHHLLIPARISENELKELNQTLDAKVHERTKELLEREQNLKLTLDSIGDAVIVTDNQGKITRMNPVAEHLMGCLLPEVQGQKLTYVFRIKNAQTGRVLPSPLDAILGKSESVECTSNTILISTEGTEYHIANSGAPIKDNHGEIVGAILVFRDITEEFIMQKNLHNLRNYLSNIIDSMPSLIIGINVHGKVTQWNNTATKLTAISSDDAKGKKLNELIPSIASLANTIKESIFSKTIHKERDTGIASDIGILHEEITIYPLSGNDIQQGAVIRIDDISEKVTLENQLLHSRKMDAIGQLSGGIAHDFNNMLNGILVSAEMLQLDHQDADTETIGNIEVILQAALQASELSKKLLTFSSRQQIKKSPLDVYALLEESHAILSRTIDKKVHISLTNTAQESTIFGDSSSLQNVLINLGINASHAMPKGGSLTYKLSNTVLSDETSSSEEFPLRPGKYVVIKVSDTGTGISQENLEKIFEPFFTTKGIGQGTGLGLSASYGTIKDHNGSIAVDSVLHKGTTFTILLPCVSATQTGDAVQESLQGGSGTILLVDDETFIQHTTGKMLEKLGYKVLIASNGYEAIDIFKKNMQQIDCILMDIIMPGLDGQDTFFKLKEIDPSCKVILSSGFTKNRNMDELFDNGLWKFLPKPYRSYELADILQEL